MTGNTDLRCFLHGPTHHLAVEGHGGVEDGRGEDKDLNVTDLENTQGCDTRCWVDSGFACAWCMESQQHLLYTRLGGTVGLYGS